jgi:hypothetical protein
VAARKLGAHQSSSYFPSLEPYSPQAVAFRRDGGSRVPSLGWNSIFRSMGSIFSRKSPQSNGGNQALL